ncbi:MAG TPA: universal stress protein [Chromatiaceae bacterium]|nr:universal stress protein [Chromatiaceae bacterium]
MKHFKNILYLAEPGKDQTAALARAVSLAENNQARLTLLEIIEPPRSGILEGSRTLDALFTGASQRRMAALEALAEPYQERLDIAVKVRLGTPYLEAIREVLAENRDLVIKLANPEEGLLERFLGGTDLQLLRKCPCPVLVMSPQDKDNYRRILAAVDFDPWRAEPEETTALNRQILGLASSLALSDFADLHLAHSWEPLSPEMMRLWSDTEDAGEIAAQVNIEHLRHQEGFERLARQLRDWIGDETYDYLTPRLHLLQGSARETIPALAARMKFDLVIMGTVGRAGIPGAIIGNTAEAILGQLRCALLAVKPADFVTPVTLPE